MDEIMKQTIHELAKDPDVARELARMREPLTPHESEGVVNLISAISTRKIADTSRMGRPRKSGYRLRMGDGKIRPKLRKIADEIAFPMGIPSRAIANRCREPWIVKIRWRFISKAKENGATISQIARFLKRNHASILYALKKLQRIQ